MRRTLRRLDGLDEAEAAHMLERTAEVLRLRIEYPPVAVSEREQFLNALLRAIEDPVRDG